MYQVHWGLKESPFPGWIDPDYFYASSVHQEALARLQFLVENRRRLGLLAGEPGSGKSMVFDVLARQLRQQGCQVAITSMLGVDQSEFLANLAQSLGIEVSSRDTLVDLWRGIGDRLVTNRYQRIQTVMLLDDTDEAASDAQTSIVRLVQLDQSSTPQTTVVLSATRGRCELLGQRLQDLCELRIDLERLPEAQTREFVEHSLSKAGREAPAFQHDALARLQTLSEGLPRRIGQLSQLCLVAGAGQGLNQIDVETVEASFRELSVTPALCS